MALIAIVLLTGCTATVVRWNSVKMREEIIAYYNDEIMDNLIRMSEGLPFVHVDISSVSAAESLGPAPRPAGKTPARHHHPFAGSFGADRVRREPADFGIHQQHIDDRSLVRIRGGGRYRIQPW